ncbi:hypothetical protein DGo_PC0100 (plasmid) [Deinococcus gobiensis I-0]|uniref:Uncharacterized protein n=1 Tax=Deinococcus gobiensis (strain DSM 21396 / JCM 16679 / CGMCC 1.7299 / I-0) TaxID=745776 RepID=H8H2Z5_DEIGI|nr:hypothetical protein DGo_PC0100 [Deinococcus gobiensis I-0]
MGGALAWTERPEALDLRSWWLSHDLAGRGTEQKGLVHGGLLG